MDVCVFVYVYVFICVCYLNVDLYNVSTCIHVIIIHNNYIVIKIDFTHNYMIRYYTF